MYLAKSFPIWIFSTGFPLSCLMSLPSAAVRTGGGVTNGVVSGYAPIPLEISPANTFQVLKEHTLLCVEYN